MKRSFVHDTLSLLGTKFFVMGLSFASGVLLARCLEPAGRGLIAAITVYPMMFISLTDMGVRQSSVYYLGKGIFSDRQVVGAVMLLILLTSVLGITACSLLLWLGGNPQFTPALIALSVAIVPLTVIKTYCSGIFLGKGMVGAFAGLDRITELQQFLAMVLLVWLFSWGVSGALVATAVSGSIGAIYAAWRVTRIAPCRPRFDWEVIQSLLAKGIVFAIALFVIQLNYKVDIALMERLTTVNEIGVYAISVGIAQLTWVFPQAITTALFSHSANAPDEAAFSRKVARLFRVMLVIALVVVGTIALTAPILVPMLYGPGFRSSASVLQILLPGVFCLLPLKVLNMDLAGRGRPGVSLCVMTPALILNVLLNFYLLPRYGARGAAVASSISYSFGGIGMMLLYCRLTRLSLRELWHYQWSDFDFVKQIWPRKFAAGLLQNGG